MATVSWEAGGGWAVASDAADALPRALRSPSDPFVARLAATGGVALASTAVSRTTGGTAAGAGFVAATVDGPGPHVLLARLASGAIVFAWPETRTRGSRLLLRLAPPAEAAGSRGPIRLFLLRLLAPVTGAADALLPALARSYESALFQKRGLSRGLVRVTREGLLGGGLGPATAADVEGEGPALLFLHGTFSHTAAGFRELVDGPSGEALWKALETRYRDRIFGFEHATVGETPEENARLLRAALPRGVTVDCVSHSRGGLVARALFESRDAAVSAGTVLLAACPNEGTALASPKRFKELVTQVANLVDLFPSGPMDLGVDFVSSALSWIVARVRGAVPGLAAMEPGCKAIRGFEAAKRPEGATYAALVTAFAPSPALAARLLDMGTSRLFGTANDLVVPTDGGTRPGTEPVPEERVGRFGPFGNLPGRGVHHLNLFDSAAARAFVAGALLGSPAARRARAARAAVPGPAKPVARARAGAASPGAAGRSLELVLLPPGAPGAPAPLLGLAEGARVAEKLTTKGGLAGETMRRIIAMHERIGRTLTGRSTHPLPGADELVAYGTLLFEALLPGDLRRLYDVARARAGAGLLDFTFTSLVPWVADKPWELAYDPSRKAFLALEDVSLSRGVFTPVPPAHSAPGRGPLRILVAAAQPAGLAALSTDEELARIEEAFEPLVKARLASIVLLPHATADGLADALSAHTFDVVHVAGHGEFDEATQIGYLLLEDARGRAHRVDYQTLRQLLSRRSLALVFLNACETARGSRVDFHRGLAPALVAGGVPAVVANQYPVMDLAATRFAAVLYRMLASGRTLGEAMREARVAIAAASTATPLDWAVPVLFARDAHARLRASKRPAR
ncbi:MAG: CHAT domain-containing protein [Acidobacteria bacterium]|nr:CHAT domain-containing protein [Acidobacteriota bacterium]